VAWRCRVVRGCWTGRSLRIELEAAFGPRRTVEEIETLAGRMREAVSGALERVTAVTAIPRPPLPGLAPVSWAIVPATQTGAFGGAGVHRQTWHVIHQGTHESLQP
jgi:hypothetical protein